KREGLGEREQGANGMWAWRGSEPVVYRVPALLAADPAAPVLVVEGEKDADRLASQGFVATTNPMGASKWKNRYADWLEGRHVVVIPDNDQAGREHTDKVAKSLSGRAASVKIVELPGLPEKGDVSDFLNAGGTAERLRELIAEAPAWAPPPAAPSAKAEVETHAETLLRLAAVA